MNRSILIIIADFLLVSLLAFSNFDEEKLGSDHQEQQGKLELTADKLNGKQDLVDVMKGVLEDERRAKQQLIGELALTKEAVQGQQTKTVEREKQNQAIQQALQQKELQARQLEQERNALARDFSQAQTNLQALQQQFSATTNEVLMTKEKLVSLDDELRRQQEEAADKERKLAMAEIARKQVESEKQQLAQQLQASETEKRLNAEKLNALQGEVQTIRTEKAKILEHADKLAEGVTTLAQSSDKLADRVSSLAKNSDSLSEKVSSMAKNSDTLTDKVTSMAKNSDTLTDKVTSMAKSSDNLTKEVRENRPLAANTVFNEFASNRVHVAFQASRSGLLGIGQNNKRRETEVILTTDGTSTFAVCHVDDTPLSFSSVSDWDKLTGNLGPSWTQFPIERLSFYRLDPRIMMIPIGKAQAQQLNCRVYPLAKDPFKFQDAVLVGAKEGYYGECRFQIDLALPQYVKMDNSFFRGLFGKFNPSRGDLVFTKSGELLGMMANNTYCIVIHNFTPSATFVLGDDVRSQRTSEQLSLFFRQIGLLPLKLQ
jgi:hypothetical protein